MMACAVTAVALACAPAASATDFTWVGNDTSATEWSQDDNWFTNVAPASPIGALTFFGDLGGPCDVGTSAAACYQANDDLGPLTISNLTIDSDQPYQLAPDDPTDTLTLFPTSGFGIDATPSGTAGNGPAEIDIPINAQNAQTWAIDGGNSAGNGDGVIVSQLNSAALTADLTNGGTLYLTNTTGAAILATGDGSGFLALTGTQPQLSSGAVLDAGTGFLDTSPGATSAPIAIDSNPGPNGFLFEVGAGSPPDATLQIDGPQSFGPTTTLNLYIDDNGSTPSADYSQLTTIHGGVNFGGATLDLSQGNTSSGGCAALTPGESFTLVSANDGVSGTSDGHSLSGTISYQNAAGNTETLSPGGVSDPIPLDPCVAGSTTTSANAIVSYSGDTLVATIAGPQATATGSMASAGAGASTAGPTGGGSAQKQKAPATAYLGAALNEITHPAGRKAVAALLRRRSFKAAFHSPGGGVLKITWTANVAARRGAHKRHRTRAIATGSAHASGSGTIAVTIHLNRRGNALLSKHPRRLSVTATERFRPTGGSWIQVTKKFRL
jgi:hypothetical protein